MAKSIKLKDKDGYVYPCPYFPVGSIYLSVNDTNPTVYFGGTWELIAQGRTLVGVDTSQSEFNEVKKPGGEMTHTLSIDEMPEHYHSKTTVPRDTQWVAPNAGWNYSFTSGATYTQYTDSAGGGQPHNNLQPYLTCYIWERTE